MALMALALQLGLSFGHIHVETYRHAPELAAAAPEGSRQDHGDTSDRDYCPSCAILSLLAGAQTGAIGTPATRVWRTAEEILPVVETTRPAHVQAAFRARAPPSA